MPSNRLSPTRITRPTVLKAQWDDYRGIAAAVILRAVKDFQGQDESSYNDTDRRNARLTAATFLQGDMAPFAEQLGFDPETDLQYRQWCRSVGLVAGSHSGEAV